MAMATILPDRGEFCNFSLHLSTTAIASGELKQTGITATQIFLGCLKLLCNPIMATKYSSRYTSLPQTNDLVDHQGHQGGSYKHYTVISIGTATDCLLQLVVKRKGERLIAYGLSKSCREP